MRVGGRRTLGESHPRPRARSNEHTTRQAWLPPALLPLVAAIVISIAPPIINSLVASAGLAPPEVFTRSTSSSYAVITLPDDPPLPALSLPLKDTGPQTSDEIARREAAAELFTTVVDPDELNSYYVLKGGGESVRVKPTAAGFATTGLKFSKKKYSNTEVFQAGLLAGGTVECVLTLVRHPLDTVRTRLQAYNATAVKERAAAKWSRQVEAQAQAQTKAEPQVRAQARAQPRPQPRLQPSELPPRVSLLQPPVGAAALLDQVWLGLGPALLSSVFQGSVFWAVKDVTRREALAWLGLTPAVQGSLLSTLVAPPPVTPPLPGWAVALQLDWRAVATLAAVFVGEAAYWLVRAPTEVVKVAAQAQLAAPPPPPPSLQSEAQSKVQAEGTLLPDASAAAADADADADGDAVAVAVSAPPLLPPPPTPPTPSTQLQPRLAATVAAAGGNMLAGLAAFPVLALTDLPVILTRTYGFLVLRSSHAAATLGLGGLDQARPATARAQAATARDQAATICTKNTTYLPLL